MNPWHPIEILPLAPAFCQLRLEDGQEIQALFDLGDWWQVTVDAFHRPLPAPPVAWRPEPACAACGAPASEARLEPAGSEYWPEQRAELTCDACAERLTLAAERFRRVKGWMALQERLSCGQARLRPWEARP